MSWARFDDQFWSHPKVIKAGNEAVGAFVRMIVYCCAHLTDGHVPSDVAGMIAGSPDILSRLADAKLIAIEATGYYAPDFLEYNLSAEQVKKKRKEDAERKAAARAAKESVRSVSARTPQRVASESALPDPSRPLPEKEPTNPLTPLPETAGRSDGNPICPTAESTQTAVDLWELQNAVRSRSEGKIDPTLVGTAERAFLGCFRQLASQGWSMADFEAMADCAAAGQLQKAYKGALALGAMLGKPDGMGEYPARGLAMCLSIGREWAKKKTAAPVRVVVPAKPEAPVLTPQELGEHVREAKKKLSMLRMKDAI